MTDTPITRSEVEKLVERLESGQQQIKKEIFERLDRHEQNHDRTARETRDREERSARDVRTTIDRGHKEITNKLDELKDELNDHTLIDETRFSALEAASKTTRIYGAIGLGVNAILAFLGIKAPTGVG